MVTVEGGGVLKIKRSLKSVKITSPSFKSIIVEGNDENGLRFSTHTIRNIATISCYFTLVFYESVDPYVLQS
ncbi:unnamed protein product [Parnassius mnemosyne]|uniref:Uncharacterized protein n=1 Tax=Parnassius mnemosyne TaxID=213953 RepID=A0AAV1KKC8_9NEOP